MSNVRTVRKQEIGTETSRKKHYDLGSKKKYANTGYPRLVVLLCGFSFLCSRGELAVQLDGRSILACTPFYR